MNDARRPRRSEGFTIEEVEGELVLFDPASSAVIYCNPTASLVWQLCDGTRPAEEIAALLVEAYPEGRERIPGEVDDVLEALAGRGAIEYR